MHAGALLPVQKKKERLLSLSFCFALERTRTSDPLVRSQVLYPTELPVHEGVILSWKAPKKQVPKRAAPFFYRR